MGLSLYTPKDFNLSEALKKAGIELSEDKATDNTTRAKQEVQSCVVGRGESRQNR